MEHDRFSFFVDLVRVYLFLAIRCFFLNSLFMLVTAVLPSIVPHTVVSSAYVMKSNLRLDCAISLIYIMKSKGSSIDPWGTPVVIYSNFDSVPL